MVNQTVSVTFSNQRTDESAYVILEQKGTEANLGQVTKTELIQKLSTFLYGGLKTFQDCGLSALDGQSFFTTTVYAYYSPASLSYEVGLTNGRMAKAITENVKLEERVKFSLSKVAQVKYGVNTLTSIKWEGDVWDKKGKVLVNFPDPVIEGRDVIAEREVYGTAIVKYTTRRDKYFATVYARADVPENLFESVAWARWDGGVDLLTLDAPIGASSDVLNSTSCLNRGGVTEVIEDDETLPTINASNTVCETDYCTFEPKDDNCGTDK